jgi:uncharacterized protein YjbJ (UPF0337 family)
MGFLDKLFGRGKQAAGDVAGNESMREEGVHQEQKGAAEDAAAAHESQAQEARKTAAEEQAKQDKV